MTKGKVVEQLPKRGVYIPESSLAWDELVLQAQKAYPKSILAMENEPESTGKAVRNRRREPYWTDDGHVVVSVLESHIDSDGVRRGNIYLTWQPNGDN